MVAPSYQKYNTIGDPYYINKRQYIVIDMGHGKTKSVRYYTEAEYNRLYPPVKIIQPAKSRRDTLGFGEAGYIWVFKGETYENLDWFHSSPCRYTRVWGWYLPSNIDMPDPLPANVEPFKLYWDEVSFNGDLIPEDQLKMIVDSKLYDEGTSVWVGKVGDRVEFTGTCATAIESNTMYGISHFYVFNGDDGNIYTWSTTARTLEDGKRYEIRGTIKDLITYKAQKQNVLTRCKVEEIE